MAHPETRNQCEAMGLVAIMPVRITMMAKATELVSECNNFSTEQRLDYCIPDFTQKDA